MQSKLKLLLLAAAIALFAVSCQKEPDSLPPSEPGFNYIAFADSLARQLDHTQFGYALSIYSGNKLILNRTAGERSKAADANGSKPFTDTTRIHVASISKTITAMAALKILQEKGISLSDSAYKYLPSGWNFSNSFKTITLRQLLTHTSGIRASDGTCNNNNSNIWSALQQVAAAEIDASKTYCYQNANFGLFRIILPVLNGLAMTGTSATDDAATQTAFATLIHNYVFSKTGISQVFSQWKPGNALLYEYPYTGKTGFNSGNLTPRFGALGWYLSAQEVGKIMSALSDPANQTLLPNQWKDSLLQRGYGCFQSTTTKGPAYWHDGLWYSFQGTDCQGMRGIWMKLPEENMTVVLLVNALRGPNPGFPVENTGITPYVINAFNAVAK